MSLKENKPRINVTIEPEALEWVDEMVEKHIFAHRSHAVEACILWCKLGFEKGELPPR